MAGESKLEAEHESSCTRRGVIRSPQKRVVADNASRAVDACIEGATAFADRCPISVRSTSFNAASRTLARCSCSPSLHVNASGLRKKAQATRQPSEAAKPTFSAAWSNAGSTGRCLGSAMELRRVPRAYLIKGSGSAYCAHRHRSCQTKKASFEKLQFSSPPYKKRSATSRTCPLRQQDDSIRSASSAGKRRIRALRTPELAQMTTLCAATRRSPPSALASSTSSMMSEKGVVESAVPLPRGT
mmetsp:Transcript_20412/g.44504  ORF Transcript_20412/g.44504 Transcript_20412/m.44504 type:complete len:243 (+) Transcript_20412:55-783(+)